MESAEPLGPLVLVVEDSQDLLVLYELILSEAGYRVATAPEGRSGLELACRLRPEVILLDMMMPDMDGLEFLQQLPSCGEPAPPVVVCSGFHECENLARARGARAFLRKPVAPEDVLSALERARSGRVEPSREPAEAERVAARREQARGEREQLWARIDLDDPELRAMLEGVLAWLSRYAGFGTGLVDLLCNDKIFVEAGAVAKLTVDRGKTFCSNVIDAGSSLVISNVADHPVFAGHAASNFWGTRFYAGCPITMSSGLVVGTVCLIDTVPRRIGLGEMRILEYLARRIAAHFEALAKGERPARFFEPPALFERPAIQVILDALLAAPTDVNLVLARLGGAGAEAGGLQRGAEAVLGSASAGRCATARWTAETLAFVCDGASPSDMTDRALTALREAGFGPEAVGVAQSRHREGRRVSADDVIRAAEGAYTCSVAAGGTLVHAATPVRDLEAA